MSAPAAFPASFVRPWKELLASHQAEQANDFPNHHVSNLDSLMTTSSLKSLHVGTGYSIYTRALLPAILAAKHSVHFVTCYWAASPTLDAIHDVLVQLASARRPREDGSPPLRIAIGFSSRGLFQKLFHTSSRHGYIYSPSQWGKLGLPDDAMLRSRGIELTVKSLFFTPLSVMHPKYVIVDGQTAFVPSCNVSWERWFEGCVELEGDAVQTLLAFHEKVWGTGPDPEATLDGYRQGRQQKKDDATGEALGPVAGDTTRTRTDDVSSAQSIQLDYSEAVPTIVLPSPHHRNPRFSFFPFLSQSDPPMTPLNAALLTLFANARRKITILTPNVTSGAAVEALLKALDRGVDVQIRTSKNMMLIEQLVTAGTTTSRCIGKLVNEYKKLQSRTQASDLEAQPVPPGKLEILYFKPLMGREESEDEPVVSHFKMTFVDDEYLMLGSGNMDRASWWTSQELGILFYVPGFHGHALWDKVLERRTEVVFQSRDH
ncbi:PLD-like domain-containing protein [Hirsutella rhossiliensis]|uniref:PLD-like domain-containing protein n=1 Tax=Hirsutella rhossiliensis TaxID=111463 RepID=A0A9P8SL35_9HYPO|nr:PLD-like domain-containing protein [Hirsutella rhossiliensis]KAH0964731.1 PLD-like domain-containing protein [Hirsutella rhossiliensis]